MVIYMVCVFFGRAIALSMYYRNPEGKDPVTSSIVYGVVLIITLVLFYRDERRLRSAAA
jgi:hypothetical protein